MTVKSFFSGTWNVLTMIAYALAKLLLFILMVGLSIIKITFLAVMFILTLGSFATNSQFGSK